MDEYRKRKLNRRKRIVLTLFWGVILSGLWWGGMRLYTLPQFAFKTIDITPTYFSKHEDILQLCRKSANKNILVIAFSGNLKSDILSKFRSIEKVSIHPKWPNHLSVRIKEKTAYAGFVSPLGFALTDKTGTVLIRYTQLPSEWSTVPIVWVKGIHTTFLRSNQLAPDIMSRVHDCHDTWHLLFPTQPETLVFRHLYLGNTRKFDDIQVYTHHHVLLKVGNGEVIKDQLERFQHFWQYWQQASQNRTLAYVDLRVPDKLIIKTQ